MHKDGYDAVIKELEKLPKDQRLAGLEKLDRIFEENKKSLSTHAPHVQNAIKFAHDKLNKPLSEQDIKQLVQGIMSEKNSLHRLKTLEKENPGHSRLIRKLHATHVAKMFVDVHLGGDKIVSKKAHELVNKLLKQKDIDFVKDVDEERANRVKAASNDLIGNEYRSADNSFFDPTIEDRARAHLLKIIEKSSKARLEKMLQDTKHNVLSHDPESITAPQSPIPIVDFRQKASDIISGIIKKESPSQKGTYEKIIAASKAAEDPRLKVEILTAGTELLNKNPTISQKTLFGMRSKKLDSTDIENLKKEMDAHQDQEAATQSHREEISWRYRALEIAKDDFKRSKEIIEKQTEATLDATKKAMFASYRLFNDSTENPSVDTHFNGDHLSHLTKIQDDVKSGTIPTSEKMTRIENHIQQLQNRKNTLEKDHLLHDSIDSTIKQLQHTNSALKAHQAQEENLALHEKLGKEHEENPGFGNNSDAFHDSLNNSSFSSATSDLHGSADSTAGSKNMSHASTESISEAHATAAHASPTTSHDTSSSIAEKKSKDSSSSASAASSANPVAIKTPATAASTGSSVNSDNHLTSATVAAKVTNHKSQNSSTDPAPEHSKNSKKHASESKLKEGLSPHSNASATTTSTAKPVASAVSVPTSPRKTMDTPAEQHGQSPKPKRSASAVQSPRNEGTHAAQHDKTATANVHEQHQPATHDPKGKIHEVKAPAVHDPKVQVHEQHTHQ